MKYLVPVCLFISLHLTTCAQLVAKDKLIAHLGHGANVVDLFQNPDSKAISIAFRNRQYEQLIDVQRLELPGKEAFVAFVKDVRSVDLSHDFAGPSYKITAIKAMFGTEYHVYNADAKGDFIMTSKDVQRFQEAADKLQ